MRFLSREREPRPSMGMDVVRAVAGWVIPLGACGVTAGEPIKPPVPAETCEAGACGPPLGLPNYTCSDGEIAGPTGRCILRQDGTCGWEVVACPQTDAGAIDAPTDAACTATQCGPRPLVADQQCDGGATAGEQCLASTTGCAWVYVPCP